MLTTANNGILVEIVLGGALSGGVNTWISAGDESIVEYNVGHNAITGGRVLDSFYVVSGAGSTRGIIADQMQAKLNIALDIDGLNPMNISIVVTSLTSNASVLAAMNWREIY
jgi:hypothetical protein